MPSNAPHVPEEARKLRAQARRLLTKHDHGPRPDRLTRENCGACVLSEGYDRRTMTATEAPDYAGWVRVYVQAGVKVPAALLERERAACADNPHYLEAIDRDLATWPQ